MKHSLYPPENTFFSLFFNEDSSIKTILRQRFFSSADKSKFFLMLSVTFHYFSIRLYSLKSRMNLEYPLHGLHHNNLSIPEKRCLFSQKRFAQHLSRFQSNVNRVVVYRIHPALEQYILDLIAPLFDGNGTSRNVSIGCNIYKR